MNEGLEKRVEELKAKNRIKAQILKTEIKGLKAENEKLEKKNFVTQANSGVARGIIDELHASIDRLIRENRKLKQRTIKSFTDAEIQKEYENRFFLDCVVTYIGGK